MDYIKGSTAKGYKIMAMYQRNEGHDLFEVYGRYSVAKREAYGQCYAWFCKDNASSNFHICSHNSQSFTVGWIYIDPETGHKIVRVETHCNTYRVDTEA